MTLRVFVVVPVVCGRNTSWIAAESHLGIADFIVLEYSEHLGVVIPSLVRQKEVFESLVRVLDDF